MAIDVLVLLAAVYGAQWVFGFANTVGFHRLLTHRSFKTKPLIRNLLALMAALFSGSPMVWVGVHRVHHMTSDTAHDPHTPTKGFWYGHCGWLIQSTSAPLSILFALSGFGLQVMFLYYDIKRVLGKHPPLWRKLTRELDKEWFMRALDTPFVISALFAAQVAGSWLVAGWWGIAWLYGVHLVHLNSSWAVNSICHLPTFGRRDFDTKEDSRNVGWLSLITLGESHHNGHHKFPKSAKHALAGGLDPSWWLIRLLERLDLAWDVSLPTAYRETEAARSADGERVAI